MGSRAEQGAGEGGRVASREQFEELGVPTIDADAVARDVGGWACVAPMDVVFSDGRTLQPEDEQLGSPRVAVISESLWRSRFGRDDGIVGRLITLYGESYRIAGVVPQRTVARCETG